MDQILTRQAYMSTTTSEWTIWTVICPIWPRGHFSHGERNVAANIDITNIKDTKGAYERM